VTVSNVTRKNADQNGLNSINAYTTPRRNVRPAVLFEVSDRSRTGPNQALALLSTARSERSA